MKWVKSVLITILTAVTVLGAAEEEVTVKRVLNANYTLQYLAAPRDTEEFLDIFTEGKFYGRVRSNTFFFKWNVEDTGHSDHLISGLGGSIAYKTAPYKNLSFDTTFYYTQAFFDDNDELIPLVRSGKDTFSRYDYYTIGRRNIAVFGQAYLRYEPIADTNIILGRQLVETFYTKSNDSKMIPNSFDAAVLDVRSVHNLKVKLGYLAKQKLRDHTDNHAVLMYDDSNTSIYSQYTGNDDSAMHKGLSYTNLTAHSKKTDAPLLVADVAYRPIEDLKLNFAAYSVPSLVSSVMGELNYTIYKNSNFFITPGVRYLHQFDNGAGAVGGANLNGKLAGQSGAVDGYKDASSLESDMIAARVVGIYKDLSLNLAYTHVLDKADLVAPWRGFPTSGYTRSMARYNWRANMSSYRAELKYNFDQGGNFVNTYVQASVLYTDADDEKLQFDEIYYYLGLIQNIPDFNALSLRLRLGYTDAHQNDVTNDIGFDALDARFEINYLF